MSQLLQNIASGLQATTEPCVRGKLLARKAAYLARIGKFGESKEIIANLRRDFADTRSGEVTVWIMWSEGLVHYFESLDLEAYDRIVRAQLLSTAMGEAELAAISSAWKSHIEFERSDYIAMIESIESALKLASPENYTALTRVSMVLSDCFFLCGDRMNGQKWFLRSRDTALKEGDQASIEALLYNKAAFAIAQLRAQRCFGPIDAGQLALLRLEIASARNLQDLAGIKALTHVVHLSDARLLMLEERFDQAKVKFESIRCATPYGEYNFSQSMINLEIDYCTYRQDPTKKPLNALDWNFDRLDVDEQMVAAWMISEIFQGRSTPEEIEFIDRKLGATKKAYIDSISELQNILRNFSDKQ